MIDRLLKALNENKINLSDIQIGKLVRYLELMLEWNKVFNLTAITDPKEMVYLHVIDSLTIAPYLNGTSCLDIGTGAGLPGIPLAIIRPDTNWTLVDKNNKKVRFMRQAIAELELNNAEAVHTRGEKYQPNRYFDTITSRAFGTLKLFIETTQHLLASNGQLLAMKGKVPQDEIAELPKDFKLVKTQPININGMTLVRHLVCLSKTA